MNLPSAILPAAAVLLLAACNSARATATPTLAEVQATKLPNAAMPAPNLVTAGQPTPEQLTQLAQLGVRRVISLRAPTESGTGWEEAKAKELGLEFVRLPVAGAPDINVANAKKLDATLDASAAPTLLYCGSSNRVGALLALEAFHVDGKSAEEAIAYGKAAGLGKLEPTVREQLK